MASSWARVQHRHLAAGAVARIERDHAGAAHGALQQQALGVLGEHLDGVELGADRKVDAELAFERGRHQALVAVGNRTLQHGGEGAATARIAAHQTIRRRLAVHAYAHAQLALALAAVDSQDAMVGDGPRRLGELVVRLVGRFFVRIHRLGLDGGRLLRELAQVGHVLRVFGHELGHDILRSRERRLGGVVAGGRVEVALGDLERIVAARGLHEDEVGERLQAGVAGLRGARGALLAIRLVEVLDALEHRGRADLVQKLRRELALHVDEVDDVRLALLEVAQVGQAVVERAQGNVVHPARDLLAVARDKRDGGAFVDERDHGLDTRYGLAELGCQRGGDTRLEGLRRLGGHV